MNSREVKIHYPEELHSFSQIIHDWHRTQWGERNWTNDTEMLLMLVDSLVETGSIDIVDYAHKLKKWYDQDPIDLVSVLRCDFAEPDWENNPLTVTRNVWHHEHLSDPSNEAINRALISGIVSGDNLLEDTRNLIQMTHNDSRCVCTAVIIARMVQSLFWEDKEAEFEELISIADALDHRPIQFLKIARNGTIGELELDEEDNISHTRKAMSSALWALWHFDSPSEILHTIVNAGGDANTNAALAMALAGLKYGFDALPEEVKKLNKYNLLEEKAEKLIAFLDSKKQLLR